MRWEQTRLPGISRSVRLRCSLLNTPGHCWELCPSLFNGRLHPAVGVPSPLPLCLPQFFLLHLSIA